MTRFSFRAASTEDAPVAARLYAHSGIQGAPALPGLFEQGVQLGQAFLVAEDSGELAGMARWRDDEGIAQFDLLVSRRVWAGVELVRAIERAAQDRGTRLVRTVCPDEQLFEAYFGWLGYRPIGQQRSERGTRELLLERRLPLLTVREQRRSDARAIGELTDSDPWLLEQGARPGWFVAADGDRVVGVVQVSDSGRGLARVSVPVMKASHRGRALEVWMLERAAAYAETNGFHTAEVEDDASLASVRKALEERAWLHDAGLMRRVFWTPKTDEDEEWAR